MSLEEQKDKILTELFLSNQVHKQVKKICSRNKILPDTFISEDIVSTTFLHLSKAKAATIISVYNQGNILGYACCIAIRKGVSKDTNYPLYHKHSVAGNILFASNLKKSEILDEALLSKTEKVDDLWVLIRENLNEEDNSFLETILYDNKKPGKDKNHVKIEKQKLFDKIRFIISQNKINIKNGKESII